MIEYVDEINHYLDIRFGILAVNELPFDMLLAGYLCDNRKVTSLYLPVEDRHIALHRPTIILNFIVNGFPRARSVLVHHIQKAALQTYKDTKVRGDIFISERTSLYSPLIPCACPPDVGTYNTLLILKVRT